MIPIDLLSEKGRVAGLCLLTMALTFLLYSPSIGHDFCLVDDAYFVVENPVVQGGLTWEGVKEAWASVHASYWAPLLWMSFMLDQELSGGAPWSFHLTNVLLFSLNAGLLFLLVRRWTGRSGVALATTLLWAFHPTRVESVAWITERKDVLSGLFFLLGLWFYTLGREAESPAKEKNLKSEISHLKSSCTIHPSSFILLSWLCMLLGGMAKQSIMVMPVALTLLDVWPLKRTTWSRLWKDVWRLTAEKWAFWILGIGFVMTAFWTQAREQSILEVPVSHRMALIPIHYVFYLQKIVWPSNLAPLHAELLFNWWEMALGLSFLFGLTAVLWTCRFRMTWALWGWSWFVFLLFPMSGVIWTGTETVALRFVYIPQIGMILILCQALDSLAHKNKLIKKWAKGFLVVLMIVYSVVTLRTLSYWKDQYVFGPWLLKCHPKQGAACVIGGDILMATGNRADALKAYEQGAALMDKYSFIRQCMVWNQLGYTERTLDEWENFERDLGKRLDEYADWEQPSERVLVSLVRGQSFLARGDCDSALAALKEAVRWEPNSESLLMAEYLRACYEAKRAAEGSEVADRMELATGIRVNEWRDLLPSYVEIWKMGARGYSYLYFAAYAARYPDDDKALRYMAWLLATATPDGLEHARMDEWTEVALEWAELALTKDDGIAEAWDVAAAVRAYCGNFSGAVRAAEKARDLAQEEGDDQRVELIEKRIMNYRLGLPWQE